MCYHVRVEKQRERAGRGGKEGRRTGGVKHQVTVYIPPRRHVAQTEEHQPLSLGKFTRQGQVYYTVVLMHRLTTLHSISLSMLHNTCHLLPLRWFSYYQYLCGWMYAETDFHLLLTDLCCTSPLTAVNRNDRLRHELVFRALPSFVCRWVDENAFSWKLISPFESLMLQVTRCLSCI